MQEIFYGSIILQRDENPVIVCKKKKKRGLWNMGPC